ncbi:pentapeptide repeat-containing protein [Vacuolonema iberomarrocanum]|uniref:pentapeptide repeat-containing protein n=1 Tax=Vacuolonema iberomarrocanum TaxID=3454632 RepID=UPI0019F69718|nr:pentapeptide repeat-containing protein [filamentous cyanobacterium LEGE 07170]
MTEQGKYCGQRLTAKKVLRLYAAGERDFRGTILNGRNFRGVDLSGADFSGAKIRGTRFVEATLVGTKFCHAEAGRTNQWEAVQLLVGLLVIACGFSQTMAIMVLGLMLTAPSADAGGRDFDVTAFAFAVLLVSAVVIVGAAIITGTGAAMTATTVTIITAPFAAVFAGFIAVFGAIGGNDSAAVFTTAFVVVFAIAVALALTNNFLSKDIERCIRQGDPDFEILRNLAVIDGTAFNGANLTEASFANAILDRTSFANSQQCSTILTRVRWQNVQQLESAHLGSSNLRDPRVRQLLTHLNSSGTGGQSPLDLADADLRGVNLAKAKLHGINLKRANLNGATFAGAGLQRANLSQTLCIGTDFTAAHLTGACLKDWTINSSTVLQDVKCRYVFLEERLDRSGYGDRRPQNPDATFQSGDFEQFFKK